MPKRPKLLQSVFPILFGLFVVFSLSLTHLYRVRKDTFREGFAVWVVEEGIGLDFKTMYRSAENYVDGGLSQSSIYPPMALGFTTLFLPLPPARSYVVFTMFMLTAFGLAVFFTLGEGLAWSSRLEWGVVSLIVTMIFYHSYPVMFEMERGNSNVFPAALMAFSLWSLRRGKSIISAITLALAFNFKLYPAVLGGVYVIRRQWKALAIFAVLSVALLFVLGVDELRFTIARLQGFSESPGTIWEGNHSLKSFIHFALIGLGKSTDLVPTLNRFASAAALGLAVLFSIRPLQARAIKGQPLSLSETGLAGAAFVLMSLIPVVSHDYKLLIHMIPFLLLATRSRESFFEPVLWKRSIIWGASAAVTLGTAAIMAPFFGSKTPWLLMNFASFLALTLVGSTFSVREPKT